MNQIQLPSKIKKWLENKAYTIDDIGMSGNLVLVFDDMYLTDENGNFTYLPDGFFGRKHIDDGRVDGGKTNTASHGGWLVARDNKGNLFTGNPIDDQDCANKKYVDDLVGDIETLLGGI